MTAILQSISILKFGPQNVLFVGDSKQATIFAFELPATKPATESKSFNIYGIDKQIAELLGAPVDQISIKDFAVHPHSKEAYLALHRGYGPSAIPLIMKISHDGQIKTLELEKLTYTQFHLKNPIHSDVVLWNHVQARTLALTDLEFVGNELLVTGLSNADFSSTLYRIPFPFTDKISTSSIEMFHAVHDQYETRAPIETMTVLNLNNKPHILAAYTCTPLVTIPLDQLKDGDHVKGKTIGELGYGNAPLDMLHFQANDMQGQKQDLVLITHKNRGAMLFQVQALEESNAKEGLTQGVWMNVVAPTYQEVPLAGLIRVDNQDEHYLAALRRDAETGRLNLISFMKGPYFRLSDFNSEYMLPGYTYTPDKQNVLAFQNHMKQSEGRLA
jgi:hypothetical protein